MTKQKCANCEETKKELDKVKKELKQAKKLLSAIASFCDDTSENTAREMSKGGIPQGKYAHLRGENQTCNTILEMMNLQSHHRQKPFRYKKMFRGVMRWI